MLTRSVASVASCPVLGWLSLGGPSFRCMRSLRLIAKKTSKAGRKLQEMRQNSRLHSSGSCLVYLEVCAEPAGRGDSKGSQLSFPRTKRGGRERERESSERAAQERAARGHPEPCNPAVPVCIQLLFQRLASQRAGKAAELGALPSRAVKPRTRQRGQIR